MTERRWDGPTLLGALAVVILFLGFGLAIAPGWAEVLTWLGGERASGWVQAIGSIAAIGGSFALVDRQHRLNAARDAEVERRRVKHRADLLWFALERLRETSQFIAYMIDDPSHGNALTVLQGLYAEGRMPLANFPVLEIQNPNLAFAVMKINQFASLAPLAFAPVPETAPRKFAFEDIAAQCRTAQLKYWSQSTNSKSEDSILRPGSSEPTQ